MYSKELKDNIIKALEAYVDERSMSQEAIADGAGVNARYLIEMRRGNHSVQTGGKEVVIADKYFKRIADFIGYQTEKQYWSTRATPQLKEVLATLQDAKSTGEVAVIIGETGCGKTYTLELFKSKFRGEVFSVKVGSADNLSDLVDKMLEALSLTAERRTKSARIRQIARHMRKLAENGVEAAFAFDEGEYMKQPALCSFKELFDYLNEWCSLVIIGTDQLEENIEKLRKRNKPGIPQLYRRIKFRIRRLKPIDRRYDEFLQGVDPELKRWLRDNCDNYGELHDVMVPAMREADRTGRGLNVDFVKMVLGVA